MNEMMMRKKMVMGLLKGGGIADVWEYGLEEEGEDVCVVCFIGIVDVLFIQRL